MKYKVSYIVDVLLELQFLVINLHDETSNGFILEGAVPEQAFIQYNSQRPNISFLIVGASFQYLWSHIDGRPYHRLRQVSGVY